MEHQHTPGPWRLGRASGMEFVIMSEGKHNGIAHDSPVCEMLSPYRGHSDNRAANARLIEAAPDLLEALEAIIDYAESDIADRRRLIDSDEAAAEVEAAERNMAAARAAIARAGGGK